jgi:Kdo2-lipid IVA lauroyltransferase/acyltransferase
MHPSAIFSYPLALILRCISFLPLGILYFFSDILFFMLFHVFHYRRKMVYTNLANSFPGKSTDEIKEIEKRFFRHFSELIVEIIKLQTIPFSELKKRCIYNPASTDKLNKFHDEGRSILIVMGHMGNWEWAGASYPLTQKHKVITAYRPLKNRLFDTLTLKFRARTGNILASMKLLPREMLKLKGTVHAVALISDQTPTSKNAYWLNFLNQETPFYKGPELIAKKFQMSVFWASVLKIKRGYYAIDLKLIAEDPNAPEFEKEGALTRIHTSFLENDVHQLPHTWLWSHRRWKHKRPAGFPLVDSEMEYLKQ